MFCGLYLAVLDTPVSRLEFGDPSPELAVLEQEGLISIRSLRSLEHEFGQTHSI